MCRILVVSNLEMLMEEVERERLIRAISTLSREGNTDACGFAAFKEDGRLVWVRMPVPCHLVAAHFAAHPRMLDQLIEGTRYLLFHARKVTVGDPYINANNHPFCDKKTKTCLIHNGSVEMKVYSKEIKMALMDVLGTRLGGAETDSARLLAALLLELEAEERASLLLAAKEAFDVFEGKASVAVANPVEMVYTLNSKATIYWANLGGVDVLATSSETLDALEPSLSIQSGASEPRDGHYVCPTELTIYWRNGVRQTLLKKPLIEPGAHTNTYSYTYGKRGYVYSYYDD